MGIRRRIVQWGPRWGRWWRKPGGWMADVVGDAWVDHTFAWRPTGVPGERVLVGLNEQALARFRLEQN